MVAEIYVRSVLNKHKGRDDWFLDDYSLNPYRLCEFGCVYCYIRGGRYGRGGGLAVKVNAPTVLAKEVSRRARRGEYGFIALGSATEPWMYLEEKYEITRRCLEVIARYRFPVHCLTKSSLILRDLDILAEIRDSTVVPEDLKEVVWGGVLVTFSFSTLDKEVARIFEPNAPKPSERLEALRKVREEGFQAGAAFIPVLPYISDGEEQVEEMVKAARDVDASYVFFSPPTLQGGAKHAYIEALRRHFPGLAEKYEDLYRGRWYPPKSYNDKFYRRVKALCKKYGVKIGIKPIKHLG